MGFDLLVKPRFDHGGGGFVTTKAGTYVIKDPQGNPIETLKTSGPYGEGGYKVQSGAIARGLGPGYTINYSGSAGNQTFNLQGTGARNEFSFGNPNPTVVSSKGAVGSFGGGGFGGGGGGFFLPPGAMGGGSSGFGALPFYIGGQYPQFQPVNFNPVNFPTISPANFNFTDPTKFAGEFGGFNRGELNKNFAQSQSFGLESLNTELKGLSNYVPATAALARGQISVDNQLNQQFRTGQIDTQLPGVRQQLFQQGQDASTYASGRLPNEIQDRMLELGIRSRAADTANFSGFGAKSSQAAKLSDLMSAEQRFQIAQYGNNLLEQNVATKSGLYLAPLEYAQTGSQVPIAPAVSADQLGLQEMGQINNATLLAPATALQSQIQQREFKTNLEQATAQFNASGMFSASTFNSANELGASEFNSSNQFAADLGKFNYDAGYLGQLQGANQANLNGAGIINGASIQGNAAAAGGANTAANQTITGVTQGLGLVNGLVGAINGLVTGGSGAAPSQTVAPQISTPQSVPYNVPAVQPLSDGGTIGGGGGAISQGGSSATSVQPSQGPRTRVAPLSDNGSQQTDSATQTAIPRTSVGSDGSAPMAQKFNAGTPVPPGYTAIASNPDNTYTAVPDHSYSSELEAFAKSFDVPKESLKLQPMANADRALSAVAGISFQPIPGFPKIATTTGGQSVYSLPAAAESHNFNVGRDSVTNLGIALGTMGIGDPKVFQTLDAVRSVASDPEFLQSMDKQVSEKGTDAGAKKILNAIGVKKLSSKTDEGQQLQAGAQRIAQLWPNLSPAQKSAALTSLAGPLVKHQTGVDLGDELVPNSEHSPSGALKVGDALGTLTQGQNGIALGRNWNQLSTITNMATGSNGVKQTARLMDRAGLLGFGPEGAAVQVPAGTLHQSGAKAAPEFGVGAIATPGHMPHNYQAIGRTPDGHTIAMPKNLIHTSPLRDGTPPGLAFQKAQQISKGEHPAQALWKGAPAGKYVRGSHGGSAISSGLHIMRTANPSLHAATLAHAQYNNVLGS